MMRGVEQQQRIEELALPPGFRFFPTDEELITCYLARKAMDASFTTAAIRDVDLYKTEPWDLPCEQQAAAGGDLQEGYFFCMRGSKSPSGVRARRATQLGYWKSTGKDKAVHSRSGRLVVGTRKTLVFYRGRAPRGEKTDWVMHEYAMGERRSSALLRGAQSEWVICRVFTRKHHPMTSDDRKLETEELAVVQGHHSPGHHHPLAAMEGDDGFDSEQEAAAPPAVAETQHTAAGSHLGSTQSMEGDHQQQHRQMAHDELLTTTMHHHGSSSCVVSPCSCWLNQHDDHHQLVGLGGAHSALLPIMQMQSVVDDADYYLPELLEYGGPLDTGGGEEDRRRRAETNFTSVIGSSDDLDGLYWYWDSGF
ncbi:NAC domain-containing protein 83 [Sorghum bicolor]|uniref:NAC domain-containing protein n=1 Tax=Sorghum bicolor TaxID=4558 RepID=C5YL79_SORBI|nr:NAC domain-containing protein 83 [Sorghum bicolor]EES13886.1 hypothetical protein SORBI_3007G136300 [Sorghum bicolor]OQU80504.1 hypothetical protein SORBI_3007G136300 [Sorghum bicolor]|eukprot:XP_002444391.1 NAC domain-containing protein 83 [Sorghum bicolor]